MSNGFQSVGFQSPGFQSSGGGSPSSVGSAGGRGYHGHIIRKRPEMKEAVYELDDDESLDELAEELMKRKINVIRVKGK